MVTFCFRHSVVPHCWISSSDKTEWRLISATLCRWRCCFVADHSSSSCMHVMNHNWFSHGTGTLRCLQKEMATYRHWSMSLWRDPDDVPHCRIQSPDKTEWRLILATRCGWRRCFVADQLWFMARIREEEEGYASILRSRWWSLKEQIHPEWLTLWAPIAISFRWQKNKQTSKEKDKGIASM